MSKRPEDVFVKSPRFIGVVTPSGNTVVERVTQAIVGLFPDVTALFSRTPVHGESDPFPKSYDIDGMMAAARLLAHASPEAIVWNGSKGAKVGLDHDRDFIARSLAETGIPTSTSILAMDESLRARNVRTVAIVSPYHAEYQAIQVATVAAMGYEVVTERHMALKDNLSFASIDPSAIAAAVRDVAVMRPDAVLTLCTNFPAAAVIPALEAEYGMLMLDSTSIGVWKALRMIGLDTSPAAAWGRVFAE
ncbi:aspartate/glutamate racemase family protein [soil metagenome]